MRSPPPLAGHSESCVPLDNRAAGNPHVSALLLRDLSLWNVRGSILSVLFAIATIEPETLPPAWPFLWGLCPVQYER